MRRLQHACGRLCSQLRRSPEADEALADPPDAAAAALAAYANKHSNQMMSLQLESFFLATNTVVLFGLSRCIRQHKVNCLSYAIELI